jgi:hypothetical protein
MVYTLKSLTGSHNMTATLESEYTLENSDAIEQHIREQVIAQGGSVRKDGDTLSIPETGQFFRLPKIDKVRKGVVTFRSKDFVFSYTDSLGVAHNSYCDKPKASGMTKSGFITVNFRGEKTYWDFS